MRKLIAGVSLVAALAVSSIHAQTGQGVVSGEISDPSGAAVASAAITLKNQDTGVEQREVSGRQGEYRFALVPPGMYSVVVNSTGFGERIVKDVKVDPSQTVPVNITLAIAGSKQTVEITADTTLVQTESADLAETINTRTIQDTRSYRATSMTWRFSRLR